jgi:Flp pilus assembly protein TadG
MKKHLSALANATKARLKAFGKDQSGSVIQMVGYSVIPIFLCAGVAIDTTRVNYTHQKFASSLDSAAIAAAAAPDGKTTAELKAIAKRYVEKNFKDSDNITIQNFDLVNSATKITVTGTARVRTSIMFVAQTEGFTQANTSYVDISLSSEVVKAGESIEVALILDNTTSMAPNMADLKKAAKDFVAKVLTTSSSTVTAKIALVPYNRAVNLGSLAAAVRGGTLPGTSTTPGYDNFTFKNPSNVDKTFQITTCVSERTGTEKYTDAPVATNPVGRVYYSTSTNNPCISTEVMPLTNNKANLESRIDMMASGSSSAGQAGIAWGWYTLSPTFGLWTGASVPSSYSTPKMRKIAILMTDGEYNSAYCNGVISGKPINPGIGNTGDSINCEPTNDKTYDATNPPVAPSPATQAQLDVFNATPKDKSAYFQSKALCAAMKAKGIEIYTIEFQLNTAHAERVDLVSSCATDASHRVTASNGSELQTAFAKIASSLVDMRVAK